MNTGQILEYIYHHRVDASTNGKHSVEKLESNNRIGPKCPLFLSILSIDATLLTISASEALNWVKHLLQEMNSVVIVCWISLVKNTCHLVTPCGQPSSLNSMKMKLLLVDDITVMDVTRRS